TLAAVYDDLALAARAGQRAFGAQVEVEPLPRLTPAHRRSLGRDLDAGKRGHEDQLATHRYGCGRMGGGDERLVAERVPVMQRTRLNRRKRWRRVGIGEERTQLLDQ